MWTNSIYFSFTAKSSNGHENDILGSIPVQPIIYTSGGDRVTRSLRTGGSTHKNIKRPSRPEKTVKLRWINKLIAALDFIY